MPVLLVALTIVLLPVAALAQAPARVPTVGVLSAAPGASAHHRTVDGSL